MMKNQLTAGVRRATTTFQSFSAGQKAVTIVAIVALAVGGYFFSTWAAQPNYTPLFSNLASSDAAAIVDKLGRGVSPAGTRQHHLVARTRSTRSLKRSGAPAGRHRGAATRS